MTEEKTIDRDYVCKHILPRLFSINYDKEKLSHLYTTEWNDFTVGYYFPFGSDGKATATITKDFISGTEWMYVPLARYAVDNLRNQLEMTSLNTFLASQIGSESFLDPPYDIYILSNADKVYGAAAVMCEGVFKYITEKTGWENYILIPSSVHEWLIMPYSDNADLDEIRQMITEVNDGVVLASDILSYDPYIYKDGYFMRYKYGLTV